MAERVSAGILLFRRGACGLELLLAHPGGPFFARRDEGHWSIPKGEPDGAEDLLIVARREIEEETGHRAPAGTDAPPLELGTIVQKGGKVVHAWAIEGDLDPAAAVSNEFEMEWPPRSGRRQRFPEIDRVAWFEPAEARRRLSRPKSRSSIGWWRRSARRTRPAIPDRSLTRTFAYHRPVPDPDDHAGDRAPVPRPAPHLVLPRPLPAGREGILFVIDRFGSIQFDPWVDNSVALPCPHARERKHSMCWSKHEREQWERERRGKARRTRGSSRRVGAITGCSARARRSLSAAGYRWL